MKKFAVLKKIGDFDASVVREFDDKQPYTAMNFATALQDSEDKPYIEYAVAEIYSVEEWVKIVPAKYCGCAACEESK